MKFRKRAHCGVLGWSTLTLLCAPEYSESEFRMVPKETWQAIARRRIAEFQTQAVPEPELVPAPDLDPIEEARQAIAETDPAWGHKEREEEAKREDETKPLRRVNRDSMYPKGGRRIPPQRRNTLVPKVVDGEVVEMAKPDPIEQMRARQKLLDKMDPIERARRGLKDTKGIIV